MVGTATLFATLQFYITTIVDKMSTQCEFFAILIKRKVRKRSF